MVNSPVKTNYVHWEGDPSSKMWALGEAPGATEDRTGRVFSGSSGTYYDMILRDAGIMRSSIMTWNIFPKRPPRNEVLHFFRDKQKKYLTEEGQELTKKLISMIRQYSPHLILALGGTAMTFLTGEEKISVMRGSILPCIFNREVKVYPTYHPSFIMRMMQESGEVFKSHKKVNVKNMNAYPTAVKDFIRAKQQSEFREMPKDEREYVLPTTVQEVKDFLFSLGEYVASDIETIDWQPPAVTRIGFADSPDRGISIPFIKNGAVCWTLTDWADIMRIISEVYLSGRKFIFQNGLFDLTVLGKIFGIRLCEGSILDTMVQQHCVYPYLPKGLAYQCSVYTWQPYYKDDRKKHKAGFLSDDALSIYNIRDCCVTKEIQPITYRDILEFDAKEGYERTLSLFPSILSMMMRGVKIDVKRKYLLENDFLMKQEKASADIEKLSGNSGVNPNAPKQLGELLYVTMGFPAQTNRKTGKLTTNIGALMKLEKMTGHPIFGALRAFRKYSKLYSTYAKMEIAEDGRIYTSYDPTGTATWRLSSYESHLGVGTNLQTMPKRSEEGKQIRKLFIPDDGFILLSWDYPQAEDRVVTWKAGDEEGIEEYLNGVDPHWQNAIRLFRLPANTSYDKQNPDHYKMRNKLAKHAKHAGNYEVGPIQLRDMLITMADFWEYSVADCKALLEAQRRAKPRVEQWKLWVKSQVNANRTLVSCVGRKRKFLGRLNDDLYRKAIAFDPQNTVGELTTMALRDVHRELEGNDFNLLMNMHDEGVAQCREDRVEYFAKRIKEIATKTLEIVDIFGIKREMTLIPDFSYGKNFGSLEDM